MILFWLLVWLAVGLGVYIIGIIQDTKLFKSEIKDLYCDFGKIGGTFIIIFWTLFIIIIWPVPIFDAAFTKEN